MTARLEVFVRLLRTEPVLCAAAVQACVAIAAGLGLSAKQSGAIEAATTAVLGVVVAWHVRPVPVPAFTGAVAAVVTLLVAFGVPAVPAGTVSAVNAALVAVLALFRGHVTPVAGAPVASPGLPPV